MQVTKNTSSVASRAQYYFLRDGRPGKNKGGGVTGGLRVQFSPDIPSDERSYRALMAAAEALPRPKNWMIEYGRQKGLDFGSRNALLSDPSFTNVQDFWPRRIGYRTQRPAQLSHWFFVHPFLTLKVDDPFHMARVVSREWRSAIEEFEPSFHTFLPVILHFSDQIEDSYSYVFLKRVLSAGNRHVNLPADLSRTFSDGFETETIRGRRDAFTDWHCADHAGFPVVSEVLAARLSPLILKRERSQLTFVPITLVDEILPL